MKEITSFFHRDDIVSDSQSLGFSDATVRYWHANSLEEIFSKYEYLSQTLYASKSFESALYSSSPVFKNSFAAHTQHTSNKKFRTPHVIRVEDLEVEDMHFFENGCYSWIDFDLVDTVANRIPASFVHTEDDSDILEYLFEPFRPHRFGLYAQCLDENLLVRDLDTTYSRGQRLFVNTLYLIDDDSDLGISSPPISPDLQPTFAQ